MPLKGVIYISTLQKNINSEKIKEMTMEFSKFNNSNEISGILLFSSNNIIQYIEGEENKIDLLYSSILKDTRHYNIFTLFDEKIQERHFPDWGLKFDKIELDKIFLFQEVAKDRKIIKLFTTFLELNY